MCYLTVLMRLWGEVTEKQAVAFAKKNVQAWFWKW